MISSAPGLRTLLLYVVVLPIAILLGYMLATPQDLASFSMIGMVLMLLAIPLMMKWHQPLLYLSWNMSAVLFFLPGGPSLWLLMSAISLGFSLVQRAMSKEAKFLPAMPVILPLLLLALVVWFTANQTGGMGLRVFGSGMIGGKRYILIFGAILGFFAMAARAVPADKVNLFVALFFLGALSAAVGNLVPFLGQEFYFLFLLFPIQDMSVISAISSDAAAGFVPEISRLYGVTAASMGVCFYLIARHGFRGLLNPSKLWRLGLFAFAAVASLFGGFRSTFVLMTMTCFFVFYFEGLFRTRIFWMLLACAIGLGAVMLPLANKLPLPVQRTLSVLPFVEVSPVARYDALYSSEWRFEMWKTLWPEVPRYLLVGKGLQINSVELNLAEDLVKHGRADSSEVSMLAGDYHNGPLSLLIPFGLPGVAAFLWFLYAGGRALYMNYRYGDPELQRINTLLYSFFIARVLLFFFIFGAFYADIAQFIGIVGFSISLNHGIKSPVPAPYAETVETQATPEGAPA